MRVHLGQLFDDLRLVCPSWELDSIFDTTPADVEMMQLAVSSTGDFVLGLVAGVVVGVASNAAWALARRVYAERERVTGVIALSLSAAVAGNERLKFGLLHVRDGSGTNTGPNVNKVYWFRHVGPNGGARVALETRPRYRRALGLQFKCFVDHRGIPFEQIAEVLSREGTVSEISRGSRPERAWFLLPEYETTSGDGFTNNFLFPE